MVKKNQIKLLSLAVGLCVGFGAYGISNSVTANAEGEVAVKTAQEVSWKMAYGASVRIAENQDDIGIRFTAQMPKSDYDELKANTNYTNLSYGVLIAPADYVAVKPLNEATVFGVGGEKVYDWATWDETTQDWVYEATDANEDGVADYARIINLEDKGLLVNDSNSSVVEFRGSIIGLNELNKTRAFVGLGYIQYTDSTGTHYEFADWATGEEDTVSSIENNTRSMAQVVTSAIADTESTLTPTQETDLKNAYHKDVDYVVRVYKEKEMSGNYEEVTEAYADEIISAKENCEANVGEELDIIDICEAFKPDGCYLDLWKSETETIKTIPETGRAYFNLYYTTEVANDYSFERIGNVPANVSVIYSSADLSIDNVTIGEKTSKALKIVTTADPITQIDFGTEFFKDVKLNQALHVSVAYKATGAVYQSQFLKLNNGVAWVYDNQAKDVVNDQEWTDFIITGDDLMTLKSTGILKVYLSLQTPTARGYEVYVDNIKIVDYAYDFELESDNVTYVPSTVRGVKANMTEETTATCSIAEVTGADGQPTNAFKLVNTTSNQTFIRVNLGTQLTSTMTENQTVRFKFMWVPTTCEATAQTYIVSAFAAKDAACTGVSADLLAFNTLAVVGSLRHSAWYEFQFELSDVAAIKEYGYFFVRMNPYGATAQGSEWYLDDIEIVDFVGSEYDMLYRKNSIVNKSTNSNSSRGYGNIKEAAIEYTNVPESDKAALRVMTLNGSGVINVALDLGEAFVNSISVGDKLAFRMYIQKGTCDAQAFKIGFGVTKLQMNLNGGYLEQEEGKWLDFEFEMTQELLDAYKASKLLFVGINQHAATAGNQEANYYFDSFKVIKAN